MSEREKSQFYRRTLCLGIMQLFLLILLLGRLYVFQILQGSHYHLLAEGNRIATRPLLPLRGQLYDKNGRFLTQNKASFRLVLLTSQKDKIQDTLETLAKLIPFSPEEQEAALAGIKKKRGLDSIILKDELTWPEVSIIELHMPELPGLSIEVGYIRTYPEEEKGAHVLGYVGAPTERDQDTDAIFTLPGLKIGKGGLEKYFEDRLRGTPGYSAFEVNARRKVVRELHQIPPLPGENIHTTLDARLQSYAQEVLSPYQSASAVVLDIKNGDVLALVSLPSFNPNLFPQGISHKNWNQLRDNPYRPLNNKAISGCYPPGSTIKPFIALAALKAGIVDNKTSIFCPGYLSVGDHKFHCMHHHGSLTLHQAIVHSCDVYFYEIGKRVGIEALGAIFADMGFGTGGIQDFPYKKKGLIPTKDWKREKKQASWTVSDTILTSIGQGYLLATPLELAVALARLIRGDKLVPRFEGRGDVVFDPLPYDKTHLSLLLKSMADTVNLPQGTAFKRRIPFEGREMGGKTGTSQVRRITLEQRKKGQTSTHSLAWICREHGLFIGYAPIHAPRYVIAVVVEHSGGSGPAAEAAGKILLKAQLLESSSHD